MNLPMTRIASVLALFCSITLPAFGQYASLQVPKQIQYQGRVATATGGAWAGTEGYFVFALVQGATVLWNNWQGTASPADPGTVSLGSGQVLTLPVNSGVFSIRLGDGSSTNQQIPATVFFDSTGNAVRTGVKLAVWFSPDDITFTRLSPDVEFTAVPFAMVAGIAETVQARAVTTAMLADGAVTSAKLLDGEVIAGKLGPSAVAATNMAATAGVPVGAVVAWWGTTSNIPPGFELCNGLAPTTPDATLTGNKPNLLGKFPRGSANDDVKTSPLTGGVDTLAATVTGGKQLGPSEMPSHTHGNTLATASAGSHTHLGYIRYSTSAGSGATLPYNISYRASASEAKVGSDEIYVESGGAHTHPITGGISYAGGPGPDGALGVAHTHTIPSYDNRPAYLELLYIIRVK